MNKFFVTFVQRRNTLGAVEDGQDPYAVMHVTGFIRSWPPAGYGADVPGEVVDEQAMGANVAGSGNYCLVAVARLQVRWRSR